MFFAASFHESSLLRHSNAVHLLEIHTAPVTSLTVLSIETHQRSNIIGLSTGELWEAVANIGPSSPTSPH